MEFILKDVTWAARSSPEWIAALNHEVMNESMKDKPVIIWAINLQHAIFRVDPRVLTSC